MPRAYGNCNCDSKRSTVSGRSSRTWSTTGCGNPGWACCACNQVVSATCSFLPHLASTLTTTNLIARSDMIAVIPQTIASRYQAHGLLKILPYPINQSLTVWGSLMHRDRPPNVVTQAFLDLLHA